MKKVIGKTTVASALFYSAYFIMLFYYAFANVPSFLSFRLFLYHFIVPSIFLFLIIFQTRKYNFRRTCLSILFELLSIVAFLISDNAEIFITVSFIIASRSINFRHFLLVDLLSKLSVIVIVFILFLFGFADNSIVVRSDGFIRQSFGFSHPNTLGIFIYNICANMAILLHNNKDKLLKILEYALITISFLIVTMVCDSRTASLSIILLIIFFAAQNVFKKKRINSVFLRALLILLPWILAILSVVLVVAYQDGNSLAFKLNDIFSNRIKHGYSFFSNYGIGLFGHYFEYYGRLDHYYYLSVLDNCYLNMMIQFGLLVACMIFYFYSLIIKKEVERGRFDILAVTIISVLYGLMEHHMFIAFYNPVLLLVGEYLFGDSLRLPKNNDDIFINNKEERKSHV